jgi:hypothetical protein
VNDKRNCDERRSHLDRARDSSRAPSDRSTTIAAGATFLSVLISACSQSFGRNEVPPFTLPIRASGCFVHDVSDRYCYSKVVMFPTVWEVRFWRRIAWTQTFFRIDHSPKPPLFCLPYEIYWYEL